MKKVPFLVFLIALSLTARGQGSIELLQDLYSNESSQVVPEDFIKAGNLLFYTVENGIYGRELWRTDGTTEGTILIKDVYAGPRPAKPSQLTAVGNLVYFTAAPSGYLWVTDGSPEGTAQINTGSAVVILASVGNTLFFRTFAGEKDSELWMTDGTQNGTVKKATLPGSYYSISGGCIWKGHYYFSVPDGVGGTRLWRSDGTPAGTEVVAELTEVLSISRLMAASESIFFIAEARGFGHELWTSNGTAMGTLLTKDLSPGIDDTGFERLAVVNDKLFFSARPYSSDDLELYRSDGTEDGTFKIDVNPGTTGSHPWDFVSDEANNQLFFVATTSTHGRELWRSDGSSSGTWMVKDIIPGTQDPLVLLDQTIFKNQLYFSIYNSSRGYQLWRSDGTGSGTTIIREGVPSGSSHFEDFETAGDMLYFSAGNQLWKTRGTASSTELFYTPPLEFAWGPRYVNGKVIFVGSSTNYTTNLFVSDGTPSGTHVLRHTSISYGTSVNPPDTAVLDGELYLAQNHLWKTNGTKGGTAIVKEKTQWAFEPAYEGRIMTVNDQMIFAAYERYTGQELWTSDGTDEGTRLLKDIYPAGASSEPHILMNAGGFAYIIAKEFNTGQELWRTDGTEEGTVLVKDIWPGSESGISIATPSVMLNEIFYFTAYSPGFGREIWRSDGSEAGTYMVKDINPGMDDSHPSDFLVWNGTLYFLVNHPIYGRELWRSDGTDAGTFLVKDIFPGVGDAHIYSGIEQGSTFADRFYFTARDGALGNELWESDGTATGTKLFEDFTPGSESSFARVCGVIGDMIIITSQSGLWKTDGTEAGTALITNQVTVPFWNSVSLGERVLFSYYTTASGEELWVTDGTENGTFMLTDIFPGNTGSDIINFFKIGSLVYFLANDGVSGVEIWQTDGTVCGTKRITNDPNTLIVSQFTLFNNKLIFYANHVDYGIELFSYDLLTPVPPGCVQAQHITFDQPLERRYGDDSFVLEASASSSLPVTLTSSDEEVLEVNGDTAIVRGAGTAIITASQEGNMEFSSGEKIRRRVNVGKASLVIAANAQSRVYGDDNPTLTFSITGFKSSDDTESIDVLPALVTDATKESPAGTYDIVVSGGHDKNYDFTYQNSSITVAKAPLAFTPENQTKKYGAVNPELTFAVQGFKLDDGLDAVEVLPTATTTAGDDSNVGEYPIQMEGGSDDNYHFQFNQGVLLIEQSEQSLEFQTIGLKIVTDDPFTLNATSSLNLPVQFVAVSDNIQINGNVATLLRSGPSRIAARQDGTENIKPAYIVQEFCTNPSKPEITIDDGSLVATPFEDHLVLQWLLDGTPVPSGNSATLTPTSNGMYQLEVSAEGCTDISNEIRFVVMGISVTEDATEIVYPNPSSGAFFIEMPEEIVDVSLLSSVGKRIPLQITRVDSERYEADASDLSVGLYVVRITTPSGIFDRKISIVR